MVSSVRCRSARISSRSLGIAFVSLGLAISGVSCADAPSSSERTGSTSAAIQGGVGDTTSSWVLGVFNEKYQTICSGSLIAPNLLLTTRHCLDFPAQSTVDCASTEFEPAAGADDIVVASCADIHELGASRDCEWHRSARLYRPPSSHFCGNDIALVMLDRPIASSTIVPAIPVLDGARHADAGGDSFSAIGFGATAPGRSGWGVRRRFDGMRVSCIVEGGAECNSFAFGATVAKNEFVSADGGVCDGDSGGPAAIFTDGAPTRLIGVASRAGADSTSGKCVSAIYTRLDAFAGWIQSVGLEAATQGGYAPLDWTHAHVAPACTGAQCEPAPAPASNTCSVAPAKATDDGARHALGWIGGALCALALAVSRRRSSRR